MSPAAGRAAGPAALLALAVAAAGDAAAGDGAADRAADGAADGAGDAVAGPALEVVAGDGAVLARLGLGPEGRFCLGWRHSVTGGAVADCFRAGPAGLVLERSYLHDFAAGLGDLPGRGRLVPAAGGGYWIEAIDAPLPGGALRMRVGGAGVGHRIEAAGGVLDLAAVAAGRRVTLRVATAP